MRHTPGPWKYGQTLNKGLAIWHSPAMGDPDYVIAMHHGSGDQAYADVRLISTVPDMLKTLKRALETQVFYCDQRDENNETDAMCAEILAIIAKAEEQ
jgi:hypothetical protein